MKTKHHPPGKDPRLPNRFLLQIQRTKNTDRALSLLSHKKKKQNETPQGNTTLPETINSTRAHHTAAHFAGIVSRNASLEEPRVSLSCHDPKQQNNNENDRTLRFVFLKSTARTTWWAHRQRDTDPALTDLANQHLVGVPSYRFPVGPEQPPKLAHT